MYHTLLSALHHKSKCGNKKFRGQGRFNQLGGVYVNGRPLPTHLRQKIVDLASRGTRPCLISRQLQVTHGCVSKILNRYQETGSIHPASVITLCNSRTLTNSKAMEKEKGVLQQIYKRLAKEPGLTPYELRMSLIHDKICTTRNAPSVADLKSIIQEQSPLAQDSKVDGSSVHGDKIDSKMEEQNGTVQELNNETVQKDLTIPETTADQSGTGMRRKSFCPYKNPHLNNMHHFLNGFGTFDQPLNFEASPPPPQQLDLEANQFPQHPEEQYAYTPKRVYRRRNASSAPSSDGSSCSTMEFSHLSGLELRRRRGRTQFSALQLQALEGAFDMAQYPDLKMRQTIARAFDMSEQRVSVWFSNRRARLRKVLERALAYGDMGPRNESIPSLSIPGKNSPCQRTLNRLLFDYRKKFPMIAPIKPRLVYTDTCHGSPPPTSNSTGSESEITLSSLLMTSGQNSATGSAQGHNYKTIASGSNSSFGTFSSTGVGQLAYAYVERDDPEDYNLTYRPMQREKGFGNGDNGRRVTPEDDSHESITLTSLLRGSNTIVQAAPTPAVNAGRVSTTPTVYSGSEYSEEVSPSSSSVPLNLEMEQVGIRSFNNLGDLGLDYQQPLAAYGTVDNGLESYGNMELNAEQFCSAILRTGSCEQVEKSTPAEKIGTWDQQSAGEPMVKHNGPPPPYYYPHKIQASGALHPNQLYVASADGQLYMSGGAENFYEYNAMQAASYYGQMNNGVQSMAMTADQYYNQYYSSANWN